MSERKHKMKKIISVILVLCMMISFVSCASDDETPDGMKNIAGENEAYYFYVPQSWVENQFGTGAYYSTIDKSNIAIAAYSGEEYDTSAEYWEDFLNEVEEISTEFEVISAEEKKIISERNALQYVYTMTTGGVEYKIQQIFVAYSNIMYVITYTATAENFDSHTEDVQTILDEFRFK